MTLLATVAIVTMPERLPEHYRSGPACRAIFTISTEIDPSAGLPRRLRTDDPVTWDGLTLGALGTSLPTLLRTNGPQGTVQRWITFAELII